MAGGERSGRGTASGVSIKQKLVLLYHARGLGPRSTRLRSRRIAVPSVLGHRDRLIEVFEGLAPCFALARDTRLSVNGRPPAVVRPLHSGDEVDISAETTFSGSDIPDGVIANPEYRSARPIIEVSGAKNTEIKPGSVKEYDDGSESVYTETINNVDYEQLRTEGLGFQAGGWELYKTRNPILTSPDKTENIQNSDIARNIQTENIKEVIDTQFVDKNGWKVGRQSLWGAETRYASGLAI